MQRTAVDEIQVYVGFEHEKGADWCSLPEIGQPAASLAREVRNPPVGINMAIQIMEDSLCLDKPHRRIVREVPVQIARLGATVRDLLPHARCTPPTLRETRPAGLLPRVPVLLHVDLPHTADHPSNEE